MPGFSSQVATSASVLPICLLFKFPVKHLYAFDSNMSILFPNLLQAVGLESAFETAHDLGALRSQPSLSSKARMGRVGQLRPGLVAEQRTSPLQSFIAPIAREVTNHRPVPFKQLGALNCTSWIQTPSNLPGPGQVR